MWLYGSWERGGRAACLILLGVALAGCGAEPPKPQPAKEMIQKDADRFMEQLRQEERERAREGASR